jgi:hypothetical protein
MQILCEAMNSEKYCIDGAFEGRVPQNEDEHPDYVRPMEQAFHVTASTPCKCKKSQVICKSVHTNNKEWIFNTGATAHLTTYKYLLSNASICYRESKVANGRHVRANLVGYLLLRSECGNYLYL